MKPFVFSVLFAFHCFLFSNEMLNLPSPIGHIPKRILDNIKNDETNFLKDLDDVMKDDINDLFILVDKKHLLSKTFAPYALVSLKSSSYVIEKKGLSLTPLAEKALYDMASMAKKDGVSLLVSSSYRSYDYQDKLFKKYSEKYGSTKAETFSAHPNASQHRLGTAVDFGSIDDSYASTKAGKWLFENASSYGWSLSYPKGLEKITGYIWECWHYRYLGIKACMLQKKYFEDVQQYMLEFIDYWKKRNN